MGFNGTFWKISSGICFYWYIVYIKRKITSTVFTSHKVFNFIRTHALYHCQFQAFIDEIHSEYCDLPYNYHTAVSNLWFALIYRSKRCVGVPLIFFYLNEKDRAGPLLPDPIWLSIFVWHHIPYELIEPETSRKGYLICDLDRII